MINRLLYIFIYPPNPSDKKLFSPQEVSQRKALTVASISLALRVLALALRLALEVSVSAVHSKGTAFFFAAICYLISVLKFTPGPSLDKVKHNDIMAPWQTNNYNHRRACATTLSGYCTLTAGDLLGLSRMAFEVGFCSHSMLSFRSRSR